MTIEHVAIIGSGVMGTGIAQVLATEGYYVTLINKHKESLERSIIEISYNLEKMTKKEKISQREKESILNRIDTTLDIGEAVKSADLIIEAVIEDLNIKREVFHKVSLFAPGDSLIASNTSSLSINQLAKYVKLPERFLGIHFFNPAPVMRLVEVVRGNQTKEEYLEIAVEFIRSLDKTPIIVEKDIPGFIVNRILVPTIVTGVHDLKSWKKEEIDEAMHKEYGFPIGVIKLADFIGLDVLYYINENIGLIETPHVLKELIRNGKLGKKTGVGFYDWKNETTPKMKDKSRAYPSIRLVSTMMSIAVELADLGVATPEVIDKAFKLGTNIPRGPFEIIKEEDPNEIINTLNSLYKEFNSPIFDAQQFKSRLKNIT